jgi:putative glutamine amidotransferase
VPTGPVIGIAGAAYAVARPFGELAVHGAPRTYVDHVVAAGGFPVVLPPGMGHEVIDVLDGVVLAGGGDLDPTLYGPTDERARDVDRSRDDAEITLVRRARAALVPVLGVCRGLQVFAVADGGRLVPDLGPERPHVLPHGAHPITTVAGSTCAALLGGRLDVNSLHHQSVDRVGTGWHVTVRADDGVVEAIEWAGPTPWAALGVQWHPELDHTGTTLFGWLVRVAHERSALGDVIRAGRPGSQDV